LEKSWNRFGSIINNSVRVRRAKNTGQKRGNMRIKLLQGKYFFGDCGSSNWRESGEEFEAKIKKENEFGIENKTAEVKTPFMQHSIKLYNNEFQKEFMIVK
jgi:hypothetical protein